MKPQEIIASTDWKHLEHAYGEATDTPDYLRILLQPWLEAEDENFKDVIDHLYSAVLHQYTVYPATVPVWDFITQVAPTARLSVRGVLLEWMWQVSSCLGDPVTDQDLRQCAGEGWEFRWMRGIQTLQRHVAATIPQLLEFSVASGMEVASVCWTLACASEYSPPTSALHQQVRQYIWAAAAREGDPNVITNLVGALARIGEDTSGFLAHPNVMVRAAAALHDRTERGTDELVRALQHPELVRQWPLADGWSAVQVIAEELVGRNLPVEDLALAANKLFAAAEGALGVEEWQAMFAYVTGLKRPNGTTTLSPQQCQFAQVLVDNPRLWDPRDGNLQGALLQLGLPTTRDGMREIIARSRR